MVLQRDRVRIIRSLIMSPRKEGLVFDGRTSFGGERAIPEKRVRSVTGEDERKKKKGKRQGLEVLSGWAAGTFYVPRTMDRAWNKKWTRKEILLGRLRYFSPQGYV